LPEAAVLAFSVSASLDDLAVFLEEAAYVRVWQKIEDDFGRTIERHSFVSHDDWPD
jgi:hypothetical protein